MMRLINDCHEAPNLQLMYWPELDVVRKIYPRRAFLVAKHDIPASVELTWDYGKHYPRHWLGVPAAEQQEEEGEYSSEEELEIGATVQLSGQYSAEQQPQQPQQPHGVIEAREQLLFCEELLPWDALDACWYPRSGASKPCTLRLPPCACSASSSCSAPLLLVLLSCCLRSLLLLRSLL